MQKYFINVRTSTGTIHLKDTFRFVLREMHEV